MARIHRINHVVDSADLNGCHLVLAPGEAASRHFALTCAAFNLYEMAILDPGAANNESVPYIAPLHGECLSLGSDFMVTFGHKSLNFNVSPDVGDLVVAGSSIYVTCHSRFGTHLLDLDTGAVIPERTQPVTVIRRWSLSFDLDPRGQGEPIVAFSK
jgi:hypothetical protein